MERDSGTESVMPESCHTFPCKLNAGRLKMQDRLLCELSVIMDVQNLMKKNGFIFCIFHDFKYCTQCADAA